VKGIYVERSLVAASPEEGELVELDAQLVPILLSAIGGRLGPSHYATPGDYLASWPRLAEAGERFLMGGIDRLVREVRALRDGSLTAIADQDPLLDPFTLELFSLRNVGGFLSTNGKSAAFILEEIRVLQVAANAGDAEAQAELVRIAAIIVGVV